MARDVTLVTLRDTPVQVVLLASDEDISPDEPHPLEFTIVNPPQNGTLSGDLTRVRYDYERKTASVVLTYTPARGYVGPDSFVYAVADPARLYSLGMVRIDVARPPAPPPTLRGTAQGTLTLKEAGIADLSNSLDLTYIVDYMEFGLASSWSVTGGWSSLILRAVLPAIDTTKIRSTLAFSPQSLTFSYWDINTTFSYAGLSFRPSMYLSPSSSYAKLVIDGRLDAFSFTSDLTFALPVLEFSKWVVRSHFPGPCCGFRVSSEFSFTKAGFDYLQISVSRIPIPEVFCPTLPLHLNLTVKFTSTLKDVDVGFGLDARWPCCVSLRVEPIVGDTAILGVYIYALDFRMTLPGGVSLWIGTSLDSEKDAGVTGYAQYFEVWHLTGPLPSCCGPVGRWNLYTYFQRDGTLFGWGAVKINLAFALASTVWTNLEWFMPHTGAWELKIGLKLSS